MRQKRRVFRGLSIGPSLGLSKRVLAFRVNAGVPRDVRQHALPERVVISGNTERVPRASGGAQHGREVGSGCRLAERVSTESLVRTRQATLGGD